MSAKGERKPEQFKKMKEESQEKVDLSFLRRCIYIIHICTERDTVVEFWIIIQSEMELGHNMIIFFFSFSIIENVRGRGTRFQKCNQMNSFYHSRPPKK